MVEVYLIRHGQTKLNHKLVLQGHIHGELDATGIAQSKAVAEEVGQRDISRIYTSDLRRAVAMAEYIQKATAVELVTTPCLRERSLGIFEGLTLEEIKLKTPLEYGLYTATNPDPDYVIPQGESINQMTGRILPFLSTIVAGNPDGKIAVVTHSGPLDAILRWTLGIPFSAPRRFKIYNASINTFCVEDSRWCLKEWGSVRHLQGLESIDINV